VNCRVLNWPGSWLHPIQNPSSSWAMWSQNLWPCVVSLALAGHFLELPNSPKANPYEIMVTDGRVHDIDQDDLDRWYVPSVKRLNPNIVHDFVQLLIWFVSQVRIYILSRTISDLLCANIAGHHHRHRDANWSICLATSWNSNRRWISFCKILSSF